jgi:hypothetical protein
MNKALLLRLAPWVIGGVTVAGAIASSGSGGGLGGGFGDEPIVPEIDLATVSSAVTLLVGGLLMITRGRGQNPLPDPDQDQRS